MRFTKKMKKMLITAAVLAIIGIILCIAAFAVSKKDETPLLSQTQDESGEYIFTYEFDTKSIKKLAIELSYANIKLVAGADKAKLELVNYPIDNFSITVSATTVSLEEKSTLSTLFSFNYDGIRNYYNSIKMARKERAVNIYLPAETALKLIDIDLYSGNIYASNITSEADLDLDIDYGSVFVEGFKTSGELAVKIGEGNLEILGSDISTHSSNIKLGYESIVDSLVVHMDSNIEKGYFKYETGGDDLISAVLRLKSENGRVRFGGDIYESGGFNQGIEYSGVSGVVQKVINVHLGEGNIMITE